MRNFIILLILLLIIINLNKENFNNYKHYDIILLDETDYDFMANKYINLLLMDPSNDHLAAQKKIWTLDEINSLSTNTLDNPEIKNLKFVKSTSQDPELIFDGTNYSYDNAQALIDKINNKVDTTEDYKIYLF